MIGSASERAGTIRFGVEAISRVVTSRVPWATVLVRKAYGVAAAAHFGPKATVLSWPSAESGALPIEGGVAVAFRRQIAEARRPRSEACKELEEALAKGRSPFPRAEAVGVHDLIDPRETRVAALSLGRGASGRCSRSRCRRARPSERADRGSAEPWRV